uniref:Secreted protein n=1 Tax=Knipowitschia caucasica TaxID=637954 RepID=A0AAV2JLI8_KNICA
MPPPPPRPLSVALFHVHCLLCKALRDLLSAGVSLMGCNNTVPFSPTKVVDPPPSADERTPAGCPVCACVLWQTYKPGSSTPWLSKQGFSTGAYIKKSSGRGLQESEMAGCSL